MTIRSA